MNSSVPQAAGEAVQGAGFVRASAKVALVKLASFALTALTTILIAHRFGVSRETDALFIGRVLPLMLATQTSRVLSTTLVPIIVKQLAAQKYADGERTLAVFLAVVPLILVIMVTVYFFLAPHIIELIGWGLDQDSRALATQVTRVLGLSLLFVGISAVLEAYLNAHRRFLIPELIASIYPLGTGLGVVLLTDDLGILGVAVGTLFGTGLMVGLSFFTVHRLYGLRLRCSLRDSAALLRRAGAQILPVFWGGSAAQISTVIMWGLASTLGPGQVSVLSYGYRICSSAPYFLGLSLGKVILPYLAQYTRPADQDRFQDTLLTFARIMLLLFVAITALLVVLRYPVIALVLGHGMFAPGDVAQTARVVACFAPGILLMAINLIVMRAFFSLEQGSVVFHSATLFMVVCVAASLGLVRAVGVEGLALAYSLGLFVQMCYIMFLLQKRTGVALASRLAAYILVISLAAAVASGLVEVVRLTGIPRNLLNALWINGVGISLFLAVYFGVLWVAKVPEAHALMQALQARLRRAGSQSDK